MKRDLHVGSRHTSESNMPEKMCPQEDFCSVEATSQHEKIYISRLVAKHLKRITNAETALLNERPNATLLAGLRVGQAYQDAKEKLSEEDWRELNSYAPWGGSGACYMRLAAAQQTVDDEQISVEELQKGFREFIRRGYKPKWGPSASRTKREELPTYVRSAVTQEDLVLILLKAEYRNKKARREQKFTLVDLEYYELCLSRVAALANLLEHQFKCLHSDRLLALALRDLADLLGSKL